MRLATQLDHGGVQSASRSRAVALLGTTQWRAGLGVLIAVPLLVGTVGGSLAWIGTTFPGFLLMPNRIIASVGGYDWPPDRGKLFHAQVTAVEGESVRSSAAVYERVAASAAGTNVAYTMRHGPDAFEVRLPTCQFAMHDWLQVYGVLLLIGVFNFGTSIAVAWLQPSRRPARVYFWTTLVGGIFATSALLLHRPGHPLTHLAYFAAEAFFPAVFVHLALAFPVDRLDDRRWRRWAVVPYVVAGALLAAKLRGLAAEPPNLQALRLNYAFIALGFLGFVTSAAHAYATHPDPLVRPRLRVVLLGILGGSVLSLVVFVDNALAGGRIPMQLGVALVPIFFVTVAYAIAKHDLFDVDRFVRQGFVYGLLSIVVVATYAVVLLLPARFLPELGPRLRLPLGMAFVLVLALGLDPLRRLVQGAVDRAFYRARLRHRATIDQLSASLTTLLEVSEVVAQVTRVVREAMQLETAAVAVLLGEDRTVVWTDARGGRLIRSEGDAALTGLARRTAANPERVLPPPGAEDEQAILARHHATLALPLVVKDRSVGLLLLGTRQSGRGFDADDLALLRTLAHQTAIALHNARSYEDLAALTRDLDLRVREQTDELRASHVRLQETHRQLERAQAQLVHSEKMTSLGQLVAGVAHEINNPASFVHGSLANLADYLERFVRALAELDDLSASDAALRGRLDELRQRHRLDYLMRETPRLLGICAEGSERIRGIVADLRTFARSGGAERMPVDVRDGLESTLRLLQHRFASAGVHLVRAYRETPLVHGSPGELNQAWMNLIANAVDAVRGRPAPEITVGAHVTTDAAGVDWLEVEITDNGAGIAGDTVSRIFEPFFTTKPLGEGTGLGLSIAYGAIKSHGGEITVTSAPGQGSTFTVRLPCARPSQPAA